MITKFFEWLNASGRQLHCLVGMTFLFVAMLMLILGFNVGIWLAAAITTVTLFAIMVIKEFYDKYVEKTSFDWQDIIAGMIPAVVMWITLIVAIIIR